MLKRLPGHPIVSVRLSNRGKKYKVFEIQQKQFCYLNEKPITGSEQKHQSPTSRKHSFLKWEYMLCLYNRGSLNRVWTCLITGKNDFPIFEMYLSHTSVNMIELLLLYWVRYGEIIMMNDEIRESTSTYLFTICIVLTSQGELTT